MANSIGKWITVDGSVLHNYYWDDFNPTNPTRPSSWSSVWTSWTTSDFNLSWFQPWNEVWCHARQLDLSSHYSWTLYWEFLRYNWWWVNSWTLSWYIDWWPDVYWWWYCYFWVDDDEIRPWYSKYKVHVYWLSDIDFYSPEFTVSNLSIDSTLHDAWYMRVEWSYLCYTDWTWWELGNYNQWYKHKIKYDSNFSEYVWTDYSWMIWLQTDVIRRIYYVDQYWYKRRTYEAQNWYNYPSWQWRSVWSTYKGKIRCPWNYDDASDWYWHLCFVNQNWYLMRILNWNPNE